MSFVPSEKHLRPPTVWERDAERVERMQLNEAPKAEAVEMVEELASVPQPPLAAITERGFIESALQQGKVSEVIEKGVSASWFQDKSLRSCWKAVEALAADGREPDKLEIVFSLKDQGLSNAAKTALDLDDTPTGSTGLFFGEQIDRLRANTLRWKVEAITKRASQHAADGNLEAALRESEKAQKLADSLGGRTSLFPDSSELWENGIEFAKPEIGRFEDRALFYEAATNCIYGAPGKGKTWIALFTAVQQIEAGQDVLMIDPESSEKRIICRLKGLGVDWRKGAKHFHYWSDIDPLRIAELHRWAKGRDRLFVIYDGLANAIASLGKEENSTAALEILQRQIKPFADAGASALVVDHTGKDETRGARGSSSKLGFFKGAVYSVEVAKAFSKQSSGHLRLKLQKDNEGGTGLTVGQPAADFHHIAEDGRGRFELKPASGEIIAPGAKAKMTNAEILKCLPVGKDRAMNFASLAPKLNAKTFASRCREIEGAFVEKRKKTSGQPENFFYRDPTAERAEDED
jgi:hypothetical protein